MNDKLLIADAAAAASDDCGCAPTPAERRALWPKAAMSRRNAIGVGVLGVAALSAFGISSGVTAAYAATYPSWDEVQRAKNNEASKAGEVTRIEGLIQSLAQNVATTQAAAEVASNEFYTAQQEYFESATQAEELQAQADEQAGIADESARKAGQVAAQLYRNGGDDTSLELFFSGSATNADELLSRLGTMDKLLQYNQTVYDNAVSARDSAQLLSNQATVARDERDRLQKISEEKMVVAQNAADAAQAALDAQSENLERLQAQLAALKDTTAKTIAQYQVGVEEERKRKAAEEERRRKEAEAAANAGGGGGGNGGGGNGGSVGTGGWVRPHGGRHTSGYGRRPQQCNSRGCSSSVHGGVDIANGCGAPIYAAQSGTVTFAAYNGGYGNFIRIEHGGGIGTGYAHIRSGGYAVRRNQWVNAGQVIAYAGNTGGSFGCHLHFEVYLPSGRTDPAPFMAARGISV